MLRLPVHPHIRGVYFSPQLMGPTYYGPSPHTWGLLQPGDCSSSPKRSIPTYVGFTSGSGPVPRGGPVHPHIRGVYRIAAHVAGDKAGPSPHTWGLRPGDTRGQDDGRSIPTYVGFTIGVSACRRVVAVHPHIRGVYGKTYCGIVRVHRSIPTYVGFTQSTATSPAA